MKINSDKLTDLFKQYEASITEPEDRCLFAADDGGAHSLFRGAQGDDVGRSGAASSHAQRPYDPGVSGRIAMAIRALTDYNKRDGDSAGAMIVAAVSIAKKGILIGLVVALTYSAWASRS